MIEPLMPEWSAPAGVRTLFTTRQGGFSEGSYDGLNLGLHVGDEQETVLKNRLTLSEWLPCEPYWLEQIHSNRCIDADTAGEEDNRQADAAVTHEKNQVLAIMVADCLPILLAEASGDGVAVIHAGWKGLANGVIANTARCLQGEWLAWLGAAIGPCHYEVGPDVREQFPSETGFHRKGERWMMDLKAIASLQLKQAGIVSIQGIDECTYCLPDKYFSYRRDGVTGRMAGFIWLD